MAFEIDPDLYRSASHRNMASSLIAPLQAGAVDSEIAFESGNRIKLEGTMREPLLLIAPKANLDRVALRVIGTLDPDGGATSLQQLEFPAYTEAGAFLLLHRPLIDPQTRSADGAALRYIQARRWREFHAYCVARNRGRQQSIGCIVGVQSLYG